MIRFLPESHTDFVVSVDWPAIALGLGLMVLLSFALGLGLMVLLSFIVFGYYAPRAGAIPEVTPSVNAS
jgi:cell division protein FtsW (lipid II flippase)